MSRRPCPRLAPGDFTFIVGLGLLLAFALVGAVFTGAVLGIEVASWLS